MASENEVYEVLAAFDGAKTESELSNAKRLCCELFPNPTAQLAFVDSARGARARVRALAAKNRYKPTPEILMAMGGGL